MSNSTTHVPVRPGASRMLQTGIVTADKYPSSSDAVAMRRVSMQSRQLPTQEKQMKKILILLTAPIILGCAIQASAQDREVLPIPDSPFEGKMALRPSDSEKDFPYEVKAPEDAPNVLLILTDDVGFGATSTFGGPIPTPTFDRLASMGLRYNNFHTTALCSPTRAALLTGRNHHSVATGGIMEIGVGYPGYNTLVPKSKRGMGNILKLNGWNTSWYGKNHNVPDWHTSQAGPFDLWPIGLGFEYFYGFIGGDTSQFTPAIFDATRPVEPPGAGREGPGPDVPTRPPPVGNKRQSVSAFFRLLSGALTLIRRVPSSFSVIRACAPAGFSRAFRLANSPMALRAQGLSGNRYSRRRASFSMSKSCATSRSITRSASSRP